MAEVQELDKEKQVRAGAPPSSRKVSFLELKSRPSKIEIPMKEEDNKTEPSNDKSSMNDRNDRNHCPEEYGLTPSVIITAKPSKSSSRLYDWDSIENQYLSPHAQNKWGSSGSRFKQEEYIHVGQSRSSFQILNADEETVSDQSSREEIEQQNSFHDDAVEGKPYAKDFVSTSKVLGDMCSRQQDWDREVSTNDSRDHADAEQGKNARAENNESVLSSMGEEDSVMICGNHHVIMENPVEGKYVGETDLEDGVSVIYLKEVAANPKSVESGRSGELLVAFLAFLAISVTVFAMYSLNE